MKNPSFSFAALFVLMLVASSSAHAGVELSCRLSLTTGSKIEKKKMSINRFPGVFKTDGVLAATELVALEDGSRALVEAHAVYILNKITSVSLQIHQEKDIPIIGVTRTLAAKMKSSEKAQEAQLQVRLGEQELTARCFAK